MVFFTAEEAAKDYTDKLKAAFNGDDFKFDLLLLGMGPDGHTCSLFPGHPLLTETTLKVAPITDSPKPPPSRVTLTYPVVNNARNCIFACSGAGKAEMVKVKFMSSKFIIIQYNKYGKSFYLVFCCILKLLLLFQRILKDKEDLPASRVKPVSGSLYWIVDNAAAAHL